MVWLDGGDNEAALACFEEACTVDGANASVHFCKTVALVKVSIMLKPHAPDFQGGGGAIRLKKSCVTPPYTPPYTSPKPSLWVRLVS